MDHRGKEGPVLVTASFALSGGNRCHLSFSRLGEGRRGQGSARRPPTDAAPVRQGALLDTFGKWEIRKGLIDNTYLLTGESTGDGEGRFWLHCDQNSMMTVAVPLAERTGQERLRSQAVTIRSDTGIKRAMSLIVFENVVAVAMDYEGGHNDNVSDFVDVLRAAKKTVTISYVSKTYEYDVTQLPAARVRFAQLCIHPAAH